MSAMMDTEQADNPLFNEHDLQYYRQHPKALESSSTKTLQRLSGRYTSLALIRTLASDLATKDAEMVTMRRKVEELSSLFRDHLCTAHGQSRLEADRTLHSLTMASAPAKQSLDDRLDEAATEDIVEPAPIDPFGDQHVVSSRENTPDIAITDPAPAESDSGYSTVRGVFSLFGGKSTVKARKEKRQSLGSLLSTTKTAPPPRSRGDSIGSSSLRPSIASASPGPVEMNAIVETEDLPPPLVTSRDIKAQYPAYVADVYGFIIDAGRTSELMNKNGAVVTRGTDSPIASSSSVKSDRLSMASRDTSPDRDTEAEAEPESTPWSSYLKFDRHTLGSLSWLPIATPLTANPEEVVSEAPMDLASDDVAERLQKQLAEDYQNLQKSRTIPWERFLSADNTEKEQAGWASVFRRGTISAPRPGRVTISEPGTAATNQARVERTRLILGGIPMHLRAKIWSAPILETLQHDPDEYASLVRSSSLAVDSTILAEINDDIPTHTRQQRLLPQRQRAIRPPRTPLRLHDAPLRNRLLPRHEPNRRLPFARSAEHGNRLLGLQLHDRARASRDVLRRDDARRVNRNRGPALLRARPDPAPGFPSRRPRYRGPGERAVQLVPDGVCVDVACRGPVSGLGRRPGAGDAEELLAQSRDRVAQG